MRYIQMITLSLAAIMFLVLFCSVSRTTTVQAYKVTSPFVSPTATVLTSSSSTTIPHSNNRGDNSAIPIAIIGLIGSVILAIGGIGGSLITILLPRYLEGKKITKEQTKKKSEQASLSTKVLMDRAKTLSERIRVYRMAVKADSRIAKLQILDMSRPLSITNVYIQVRLHRDTTTSYRLHPNLQEAEEQHDPNSLLQAERQYLEHRIALAQDPEDAIRQYKHCVIVGDPGAGKTTLLKYLTLRSISSQLQNLPNIPIYIELNAFATTKYKDLLDYAAFTWETRYNFPHAEALTFIQESLQEGKVMLLIDGLDETVIGKTPEEAEHSYKRISEIIVDIATRYYQTPIVVTVRKATYNQRTHLKGFTELDVLDFRPEDIKRLVTQWFMNHPDKEKRGMGNDLNILLDRNLRLRSLAANPLLLSLIAIVYEAQLELPDRRTELYKQCVDILLSKWDANRNIIRRREFKPEQKRLLLEEIAWYFHVRGQRYYPEDELLKVIGNFLPTIGLPREQNRSILEEIASANGLLKEQARGWHGFLHLTLQEYFVALYVSDYQQLSQVFQYRHQSWWEEVMLLYAGQTPDASPLIKALFDEERRRPIENY